jgi:hypothetical protein
MTFTREPDNDEKNNSKLILWRRKIPSFTLKDRKNPPTLLKVGLGPLLVDSLSKRKT